LQFDDIETSEGFGDLPEPYHGLIFDTQFYAFNPMDHSFEGIISKHDTNCAVSKPNALYGSKTTHHTPTISIHNSSQTFTLHSLKIKPLNMPTGSANVSIKGTPSDTKSSSLFWFVEFPAGFHDMLAVDVKVSTGVSWSNLTRVEILADFHYNDYEADEWEFCVDDLEVTLDT
jgi:hypothetical protein